MGARSLNWSGLADLSHERLTFGTRDIIAKEGNPNSVVRLLYQGLVASSLNLNGQVHQVVQVHFPGDVMDLSAMMLGTSAVRLTALEPSVVYEIEYSLLKTKLERDPVLCLNLLTRTLGWQNTLLHRLEGLGHYSSTVRVARLLLQFHDLSCARGRLDAANIVALSQSELGQLAGLSRIHVQRVVHTLTNKRCIKWSRRAVHLIDLAELAKIAEGDNRTSSGADHELQEIAQNANVSPTGS